MDEHCPNGFRSEPAWNVSTPCLYYMYARGEHREFLDYYHALAKRAVSRDDGTSDADFYRRYRGFQGYMTERYVCQMADYLDGYVENVLFEVIAENYSIIPSEICNKITEKLKNRGNIAPTNFDVACHFAKSMSNDSLSNKLTYLLSLCVSSDFGAPVDELSLEALNSIRNVIVHNDGFVDARFLEKTSDAQLPFDVETGQRLDIPEGWALTQGLLVDTLVFTLDNALVGEQLVQFRDRRSHFWVRRAAKAIL